MTELVAVLWDMDGTLLDSEVLWDEAVYELSERHGRRLTPAVRETTLGNSMDGVLSKLFAYCDVEPTPEAFDESAHWLRTRVGEMFDAGLPWRPGAKDLLQAVRAGGLRAALVTNTERVLTEKALNTLGREYFDAVVCGDEVSAGKPAPDPYERAVELLGLEPEHCLAIEDSPTGTHSAEEAGCAVLVVPSTVPVVARPGVLVVDSLVGLDVPALHRTHAAAMG